MWELRWGLRVQTILAVPIHLVASWLWSCLCTVTRRAREATTRAEALAAQMQQAMEQQQAEMKAAAERAEAERRQMMEQMRQERAAAEARAAQAQQQFASALAAA